MDDITKFTRRSVVAAGAGAILLSNTAPAGAVSASAASGRAQTTSGWSSEVFDPIRTELVMNLVVTCSSPERIAPGTASKDGQRRDIWPIIGGKFEGRNIRGTVVPGGGDFPVMRPDGVVVVDALYRLKTDDGVTIIIHNKGLAYQDGDDGWGTYRLVPVFTAPVGKYDWLNKSIFIANLVKVPPAMALAKGKDENDRLIQVFRIF